ncbi:hypothetical protein ACHAQH_001729 [Verticillium albo-atrum]
MRLLILLLTAVPPALALCQEHPCGEGCIPPDKICCTPIAPDTTPFACPLDYTCGPDLECRPPSPAAGPIETGVPLCASPFVACGTACAAPDALCCGNGAWSCAAGLACAPAPLQCVAPLASPSSLSSSRGLASLQGPGLPTTVADVTMPGGYGTLDVTQTSESAGSPSGGSSIAVDGTEGISTYGLASPVPPSEPSTGPEYSVHRSTVVTGSASNAHGSTATSLVEATASSAAHPSKTDSADEGAGGRIEVSVGATLMGLLLGAVLFG